MSNLSPAINKNKRRFKPTTSVTKRHKKKDQQPVSSNRADTQDTDTQQQPLDDTGNKPSDILEDNERRDVSNDRTKHDAPLQKPPLDPDAVLSIIRDHMQQQSLKRKPKRQGVSKNVLKQQGEDKRRALQQEQQVEETKERQKITEGQAATPQVTMVNGEIVLDQSSLAYTAPSPPPEQVVEVVHEGHDNLVDKNVKRRRKGNPNAWTRQEEELLYELLKEHGLAFNKISQYIPGRDARSVQRKYNQECKLNPFKIAETFK